MALCARQLYGRPQPAHNGAAPAAASPLPAGLVSWFTADGRTREQARAERAASRARRAAQHDHDEHDDDDDDETSTSDSASTSDSEEASFILNTKFLFFIFIKKFKYFN